MTRRALGRSDPWLTLAVLALVPLGLALVYSASAPTATGLRFEGPWMRQLVFALAGLAAMAVLAQLDYRLLRRLAWPAYAGAAALLVAVIVAGAAEYGARRWLAVGGVTFQPAEAAKLALVLALAAYLAGRAPGPRAMLGSLGIAALPLLLVAPQPDTGTTLVLAGAWLGMAVAWGAPWRALGGLLAAALALGPLLFALAIPAYQRERLAVFFDPSRDPLGSGFTLRQAEVALGSGGFTGRGLFADVDSALAGVSARSSDFVFSLAGERLGLLGALALLGVLALVVWRGFRIAREAPDAFGRLLAVGLTITIFTQAFVHLAVNLRLFPATGIPLPFVSQGGSALLMMCVAAGLLLSIAGQRPPPSAERWRGGRWV